jgi:hypothetical protein
MHEVAKLNGVVVSTLVGYAQRHHWQAKRQAWRGRVDAQTEQLTIEKEARRRARAMEVYDKAFTVVERVFDAMLETLAEREFEKEHDENGDEIWVERAKHPVSPKSAAELIDRMNVLLGRPESITENRGHVDLAGTDSNILVAILERSRSAAGVVGVGGSPLPRIAGPRQADEPSGSDG